jgi:hypothetical protein
MSGNTESWPAHDGEELAAVQERLCRARNMVARQAAIVRFLQRHGQPTAAAVAALTASEDALEELEAGRGAGSVHHAIDRKPAIIVFAMTRESSSAALANE